MQASIEHRKIATEQYSRPHRSAMAHGINWILVLDYQQYIRQYLYLACSDLKSRYNIFYTQPSA